MFCCHADIGGVTVCSSHLLIAQQSLKNDTEDVLCMRGQEIKCVTKLLLYMWLRNNTHSESAGAVEGERE